MSTFVSYNLPDLRTGSEPVVMAPLFAQGPVQNL